MAKKVVFGESAESSQKRPKVEQDDDDDEKRRQLRSHYLALKSLIYDEADELLRMDSNLFQSVMSKVETLHQLVEKPREQVSDADALLNLANALLSLIKSNCGVGTTPSDFVTCLIKKFGASRKNRGFVEDDENSISWRDVGLLASPIFRKGHGSCTMIGPMNAQMKIRKVSVRRSRTPRTARACPVQINNARAVEKVDTDANMSTMFEILRNKRKVRLENLILNRKSFAQTVENLFALSFLTKDGRVEITVENGSHFVSPRNAPASSSVVSGNVPYSQFVFKFGFKDWKVMIETVLGEELMPHRGQSNFSVFPERPTNVLFSDNNDGVI